MLPAKALNIAALCALISFYISNSLPTVKDDVNWIFFSRVPKCGSTMLREVITRNLNSKGSLTKRIQSKSIWPNYEENIKRKVHELDSTMSKATIGYFDAHFRYIDFQKYGVKKPVLISMVRHPIARVTSWYYFQTQLVAHMRGKGNVVVPGRPTKEEASLTINQFFDFHPMDCVNMTTPPMNSMTLFFCGYDEICNQCSPASLLQAKYNLEHEFDFVGITEHWELSLDLMSAAFPQFFENNLLNTYENMKSKHINSVNHDHLEPPSKQLEDAIRNCGCDMELYDFALKIFKQKAQFHKLQLT